MNSLKWRKNGGDMLDESHADCVEVYNQSVNSNLWIQSDECVDFTIIILLFLCTSLFVSIKIIQWSTSIFFLLGN